MWRPLSRSPLNAPPSPSRTLYTLMRDAPPPLLLPRSHGTGCFFEGSCRGGDLSPATPTAPTSPWEEGYYCRPCPPDLGSELCVSAERRRRSGQAIQLTAQKVQQHTWKQVGEVPY